MNKKFFIIFILILAGIYFINSIDIIECYNAIPLEFMNNQKYDLSYKNKKWVTTSFAGYELEAIVDKENYFIGINDHGTGGGGTNQEVTIYLTKKNYSIVAINLVEFDPVETKCTLNFFKYDGKTWTGITDNFFPDITSSLFYDENYYKSISEKVDDFDLLFNIIYSLPQYGTKITAGIIPSSIYNSKINSDSEPEKKELYEQIIDRAKYTVIEIEYDSKNMKFFIGKKY